MENDAKRRWAEFLNPDVVRTKFVAMGLFMIAHEMLLDAIRDRPLSFFSNRWTADAGWQQNDDYRQNVLALDPKGKSDALRGSLEWLRGQEAIDEADVAATREFTDARNVIAHELRDIISGGTVPDFSGLFPRQIGLLAKIDRWWIINVDIAIDPEIAGQDQDIDSDGVMPGSLLLMQILGSVALGEEEEAWELYRAFVENEASV